MFEVPKHVKFLTFVQLPSFTISNWYFIHFKPINSIYMYIWWKSDRITLIPEEIKGGGEEFHAPPPPMCTV